MTICSKGFFQKIISVSLLILSPSLFAGGEILTEHQTSKKNYPFYIKLGAGASFSSKANIEVDLRIWDPAPEGYNAKLRNSEWYEFGVGYQFTPLLALEIAGTTRPSYKYKKYQSAQNTSSTPGALSNKTRFFRLSSQSLMLNLMVDTLGVSDRLVYRVGSQGLLRPILGVGTGIAYNNVRDFHSETTNVVLLNPVEYSAASIMNNHTRRSIAYQLLAGTRLTCHEHLNIDLGYRYFNGGTFSSNSYSIDVPSGFTTPITTKPWKGKMRAQEVFVNLSYAFPTP